MYVSHLSLADFRSYAGLELPLEAGVTAFVGPNGQGKTNLVEAVGYIASLASHRVATDAPLVRFGAERAVVRASVVVDGRPQLVEIELNPGRPNRARVNRAPVPRPREVAGLLKTVLFAPEDLALVKGDPSERRRFLDELLTIRAPRLAGVRSDYERVLKQRNALLKSAAVAGRRSEAVLPTLEVWDSHLARAGADLLSARLDLVNALRPLVGEAYTAVAGGGTAAIEYRASVELPEDPKPADLADAIIAEIAKVRRNELDRGITLVGPHRDDLVLRLVQDGEPMVAKGYASHGESWSYALALRLGAYELLKADGSDPVLVLDDVFAELDTRRRARLATLVAGAEQVLITAAVDDDVPAELTGARFSVADGEVAKTR